MGSAPSREDIEHQKAEQKRKKAEYKQKIENAKYWQGQVPEIKEDIDALAKTITDLKGPVIEKEGERDEAKRKYMAEKKASEERITWMEQKRDESFKKYKEKTDKVTDAINGTNVDEGSIPQFLNLINHGLLGGTLHDTINREVLNVKIRAFGELIRDRTNTTLNIESILDHRLKPYIKYLNNAEYVEMDDILCNEDDEFEQIIKIIQDGIDAENKQIEQDNDNLDKININIEKDNNEIESKIEVLRKEIQALDETIANLAKERAKASGNNDKGKKREKDEELRKEKQLRDLCDSNIHSLEKGIKDKEKRNDCIKQLDPENKGRKHPLIRRLRRFCIRKSAQGKRGWIPLQQEKQKDVKRSFTVISPALAEFFGTMDIALTDASKYLQYNDVYNNHQMEAITLEEKNGNKLKKMRQKEEKESVAIDITREMSQRSNKALSSLKEDKLDILHKENRSLLNGALLKLDVVASMMDKFEFESEDKFKWERKAGLTLEKNVESCCLKLMESQSTIRTSLCIAMQLIQFKPIKVNPQAQALWNAIISGTNSIIANYIEMAKISATYFGFFVKFKSAFEYYLTCYERKGDKVSLTVSLEWIVRDVKEFMNFTAEMQKTVDKLTMEAKAMMSDTVNQTGGADAFIAAQRAQDNAEKDLIKRQKDLLTARFTKDERLSGYFKDWSKFAGEYEAMQYEIKASKEQLQLLIGHLENAKDLAQQT